jgi:hypothetical protein
MRPDIVDPDAERWKMDVSIQQQSDIEPAVHEEGIRESSAQLGDLLAFLEKGPVRGPRMAVLHRDLGSE